MTFMDAVRVRSGLPGTTSVRGGIPVWAARGLRFLLPAVAAAVFCCPLGRADDIDLLRERVREIIALQKAALEAQLRWDEQKAAVQRQREVLLKRAGDLETRLAENQQELARKQAEREALTAQVTGRRDAISALTAGIEAGEAALRALRPRLPACLVEPLTPAFDQLGKHEGTDAPEALGDRLRRVFSLLSEIENFDNGVHVCREMLTPETGPEREMDVLYLGLGAAYAVSTGGAAAGVGVPTDTGWSWTWDPALAEPVRNAVAVYRKERPAGFVALPLTVDEDSGP